VVQWCSVVQQNGGKELSSSLFNHIHKCVVHNWAVDGRQGCVV